MIEELTRLEGNKELDQKAICKESSENPSCWICLAILARFILQLLFPILFCFIPISSRETETLPFLCEKRQKYSSPIIQRESGCCTGENSLPTRGHSIILRADSGSFLMGASWTNRTKSYAYTGTGEMALFS